MSRTFLLENKVDTSIKKKKKRIRTTETAAPLSVEMY